MKKLKKDDAVLNVVPFVFCVMALIITLTFFVIENSIVLFRRNQIEDAITISNLSTLVIDKTECYNSATELLPYLTQTEVKEEAALYINPDIAYTTFKTCFVSNLNLINDGTDWKIAGIENITNIRIDDFIVYNVIPYIENGELKHKVQVYRYAQSGLISVNEITSGTVQTPDGKIILENGEKKSESCSYANIKFRIKTTFNNYSEQAHDSVVELKRN